MKPITATKPTIEAITPWRIESAPSDGPTVSSERDLIEAGRAPDRNTSAKSLADCGVKFPPVISPRSVIWP